MKTYRHTIYFIISIFLMIPEANLNVFNIYIISLKNKVVEKV